MSVSIRPLLIPGVAMAMAVSPAVITPPALLAAPAAIAIPTVQAPEIELAGFTQDLYDALNGWAQFLVQVAQDFFFWAPPIAQAISSLYTTFEPVVSTFVSFLDTVVTGPADLVGTLTAFVSKFFGVALPTAGAVRSAGAARTVRAAAASAGQAPKAAAAESPIVVAARVDVPEETADVTATRGGSRGEARVAGAHAEVRGKRQAAAAARTGSADSPRPAASRAAKAARGDAPATPRAARATR